MAKDAGRAPDTSIITAANPTDAVEKAIHTANHRLETFKRHGLGLEKE